MDPEEHPPPIAPVALLVEGEDRPHHIQIRGQLLGPIEPLQQAFGEGMTGVHPGMGLEAGLAQPLGQVGCLERAREPPVPCEHRAQGLSWLSAGSEGLLEQDAIARQVVEPEGPPGCEVLGAGGDRGGRPVVHPRGGPVGAQALHRHQHQVPGRDPGALGRSTGRQGEQEHGAAQHRVRVWRAGPPEVEGRRAEPASGSMPGRRAAAVGGLRAGFARWAQGWVR